MTQEDKELLLKDLCARSFYSVKVTVPIMSFIKGQDPYTEPIELISVNAVDMTCTVGDWYAQTSGVRMFNRKGELVCKPYLRPMSSMTEEERKYLLEELGFDEDLENGELNDFGSYVYRSVNVLPLFDWLNEHHLDWRGLIPMGLALEAKEGMYKTE